MTAELIDILDKALSAPEGLALQEAEREQRALQQQYEAARAVLAETQAQMDMVAERVNELRRYHMLADARGAQHVSSPRPRAKGEFVPRHAAKATKDS